MLLLLVSVDEVMKRLPSVSVEPARLVLTTKIKIVVAEEDEFFLTYKSLGFN